MKDYIWCPYNGYTRRIHPAVCEWHKQERDPVCVRSKCKRADWPLRKEDKKCRTRSQASFL